MSEQPKVSETRRSVKTYHELLTLVSDTAKEHRDSISCCISGGDGGDITLEFGGNVVLITDKCIMRSIARNNLLCQDGYAVPRGRGFWVISHERIIRDCEAEERKAKERKSQTYFDIGKWAVGYFIAATLTVIGQLVIQRLTHS